MWTHFPSPLLQTMRILKAKGWSVAQWEAKTGADGIPTVKLVFKWLAPPLAAAGGMNWTDRDSVKPELPGYQTPSVLAIQTGDNAIKPYHVLHVWAKEAPKFALPFSQKICDKCKPQGGDWFFSVCQCPLAGKVFVRFADGLPERCYYAAEQVVTMPERTQHFLGLYGNSKKVTRILSQTV